MAGKLGKLKVAAGVAAGVAAAASAATMAVTRRKQRIARDRGEHVPAGPYEAVFKRPIDVALSTCALTVLSPAIVVIAGVVRRKLGSPVLFTQERPGRNGEVFKIYKFRTMTNERDPTTGELLPDEMRLTRFGKFLRSTSLDELPELVNMLKGDMSLIGPRPLLTSYLPLYNEIQARRHDVRPGMTGLAQIHGRNSISWEEKFAYDCEYVDGLTFKADAIIFLKTFRLLFKRIGISSATSLTMEPFNGTPNEDSASSDSVLQITKRALVISQAMPQWYLDVLAGALGKDVEIDLIAGNANSLDSKSCCINLIRSPKHNSRSLYSRLACWFCHYLFVTLWAAKCKKVYDLIIIVSNPPINPALGIKLKKRFNAPLVYMNWDLYPQVLELSMGKNPLVSIVSKIWHKWNKSHYGNIDRMLTIGNTMAKSLMCDMPEGRLIDVIPIAVDCNRMQPIPHKSNWFLDANNLQGKFIVLYSGKMGIGHNIELILEAADFLLNDEDIVFVFIGDGQKKNLVEKHIKNRNKCNVVLLPFQPDNIFPYSIASGDVGVVSQESETAHLFMPSKTYSLMACGVPIVGICTENDDLNNLIKTKGVGVSITTNNAIDFAASILQFKEESNYWKLCSKNARKIAEELYSIESSVEIYKKLFNELGVVDRGSVA